MPRPNPRATPTPVFHDTGVFLSRIAYAAFASVLRGPHLPKDRLRNSYNLVTDGRHPY